MSRVRDRHEQEAEERTRLRSSVLLSIGALAALVLICIAVMQ